MTTPSERAARMRELAVELRGTLGNRHARHAFLAERSVNATRRIKAAADRIQEAELAPAAREAILAELAGASIELVMVGLASGVLSDDDVARIVREAAT